jgi:endonuclease/exonuclease/phosphatase family metal-dependent hydrolase
LSGGAVGAGGGTLAVDRRWCGVREVRRMRIASFNVENLFDRAKALNQSSRAEGREVLEAHAALNKLLNEPKYSPGDKNQMVKLLDQLGLTKKDDGGRFALLRQNRGRLLKRPTAGGIEIVANGRGDWIGWVELKTEAVNERATRNTARVITDVAADVLAVVEAENRVALTRFTDTVLAAGGQGVYGHVMVIDGNDDRGIDVGILTTAGFPIGRIRSHVDDTDPAGRVFSRDCPEYEVTTPGGERIVVLINHLKSKGYGKQADSDALRHRQATRVAELYQQLTGDGATNVVVAGDLNDTPTSDPLAPLLDKTDLRDIGTHPTFDDGGRPGTFANGTAANKIDDILLSPTLYDRVTGGGIWRQGVWGGTHGDLFPHDDTITKPAEAASDHAAIYADLTF